jgi:glycosyltransferase involved in cell wall biosynthesis
VDARNLSTGTIAARPRSICYVGNLVGRYVLGQWGSGFVLTLATLPEVERIDVVCPELDAGRTEDPIQYPPKVRIRAEYALNRPLSILRVLRFLRDWSGDLVVFSCNTTSFGSRSSSNLLGLLLPLLGRRLLSKNVVLVYHSSVLTSDVERLGYSSFFDRLRSLAAARLERSLFQHVPTYVLLRYYRDRLNRCVPGGRVRSFSNEFLEAVPTVRLNRLDAPSPSTALDRPVGSPPTILLHGYWGPQKDLDGALEALRSLARGGVRFDLVLSGSANPHFREYAATIDRLVTEYADLITVRAPSPAESEVAALMLRSDVVLLPYHASGGQSGVLEISSFFDRTTVVVDFPEYREKAANKPCVVLTPRDGMADAVRAALARPAPVPTPAQLEEKLSIAREYVRAFLRDTGGAA